MYLVVERPPCNTQPWAPVSLAATEREDAIAEAAKRHESWKPGAFTVLYHMNANGDITRVARWDWGIGDDGNAFSTMREGE